MEPDELEQLLVRTARLTEENHRMLRKMQRAERVRIFIRVIQWVLVLGLFAVLYYLIQPQMAEVRALIESGQSILDQGSSSDSLDMQLLDQYLNGLSDFGSESTNTDIDPEVE